jgi:hypothetical protein
MPDGDSYIGDPSWDLSDGVMRVNSYDARNKAARGVPTMVGLTKDEVIRTLDDRFSGKR